MEDISPFQFMSKVRFMPYEMLKGYSSHLFTKVIGFVRL